MNLSDKVKWVRKKTLEIHKQEPGTRIASSLSCVELLVALFYGKVLKFNPQNPNWEDRDRFIASKGHGTISMYPILADLGFFVIEELNNICSDKSFLGSIPDFYIPGYETINGSLGHGPGVGCGIALSLKNDNKESTVFVLTGDGELYEGAVWESFMFAAHNSLDNLVLIVDRNKVSMLDYTNNVVKLEPLDDKFKSFGFEVIKINGHNIDQAVKQLICLKNLKTGKPKVLIAETIKGKGVPVLEKDSLSHIRSLSPNQVDKAIGDLK
jgi:transketolase